MEIDEPLGPDSPAAKLYRFIKALWNLWGPAIIQKKKVKSSCFVQKNEGKLFLIDVPR
jgi:hypothetical protein